MRARTAIAGALAALCVAAPAASAAGPYVALGDSVGAGSGASPASNGYVGLLFARYQGGLGADQLFNHSVGGATSASLISSQLAPALNEINAASDTKAVTIDIGGNDYLDGQCHTPWDDPPCQFRPNLASILSQLKTALAGDPGAEPFIVMAYYNPGFGTPSEATYDTALLGNNHAVGLADTGADVGGNDVIYQEAAAAGIPVADPYPAFKPLGQSLMADSIHPNNAGHKLIADAFCAAGPAGACACGCPVVDPPPTDATPPQTSFSKRPPNRLEAGRRAIYRFESSEPSFYFECRLDDQGWRRCGAGKRIGHLDLGRHVLRVRATDTSHNEDPTPAVDRFRVVDDRA